MERRSRGMLCPSFADRIRPKSKRAQETPGARCTRSPAWMLVTRGVVTTGSPEHPAFPARWCYGLLRALPGDRAFLPPSPPGRLPRELDASVGASGPHDFAVHVSAVRQERLRVHRIPRPTSVTIATRPSCGNGMADHTQVIWAESEVEIFLRMGLDSYLLIWSTTGLLAFVMPRPSRKACRGTTHLPYPYHPTGRCARSRRKAATTSLVAPGDSIVAVGRRAGIAADPEARWRAAAVAGPSGAGTTT